MRLTPQQRAQLQRAAEAEVMRRSLKSFVVGMWSIVEPSPFVDGWCLDAICEHLEALTHGDMRFLLITVPPRHSKSTICSVLWPVWSWFSCPQDRFLCASYNIDLAIRDNMRKRGLILSSRFQEYFGQDVSIRGDGVQITHTADFMLSEEQNAKRFFMNNYLGYQLACSVGSSATGQGGSKLVIDDAHPVSAAHFDAERRSALIWFSETWSNRMNDPSKDCMLVIGQRIHEEDVPGTILRERKDWVHLNLPAEFDVKRKCVTYLPDGSMFWCDPRAKDGELLWPERFSVETLTRYKRDLGSLGYSSQYQQQPIPSGGGQFQTSWFRYFRDLGTSYVLSTADGPKQVAKNACWRFTTVDLAISMKQGSDYTVIQTYDVTPHNELLLIEQIRVRLDNPKQQAHLRMLHMRKNPDFIVIESVGYQLALIQQLRMEPVQANEYYVRALGDPTPFERDVLLPHPEVHAFFVRDEFGYLVSKDDVFIVRVLSDETSFLDLMKQYVYVKVEGKIARAHSGVSLPIREFRARGDKVARASTASVQMENQKIFFLQDGPYLTDLELELVQFPRGAHDDQVDALSMAAIQVATPHAPLSDWDMAPDYSDTYVQSPAPLPTFSEAVVTNALGEIALSPDITVIPIPQYIDPFAFVDAGGEGGWRDD